MRLDLVFACVAFLLLCVAAGWLSVARQQRNRGKRAKEGFGRY